MTTAGDRVFDIMLEDTVVFNNVDIVDLVGASYKALTMETVADVLDGALSIGFAQAISNSSFTPKLSAIQVNLNVPHVAHAVANGPYFAVDVDNTGFALVPVDGIPSHTHGIGLNLTSWTWYENGNVVGVGEVTTLNMAVGEHYVTLRVEDDGGNENSETTTVTVLPVGTLMIAFRELFSVYLSLCLTTHSIFRRRNTYLAGHPVVESLTPDSGDISGGYQLTISGYGFNFGENETTVRVGYYDLNGSDIEVVNANTIVVFSMPSEALGIPVPVTVETPIGESNAESFTYVSGVPIDWKRGLLWEIYAPTTLAFGPVSIVLR